MIRRRDFLLTAAFGALGASSCLRRAGAASEREGVIIVIGAGMAGLAAARALHESGYTVIVLEARDRVGGRVWTDRSFGIPVDLGASWIHGTSGNPITKLAREQGIRTAATDYDALLAFDHDGTPLDDEDLAEITSGMEEVMSAVAALPVDPRRDRSVGEAIRRALADEELTADERRALDWSLATRAVEAGAEMDELSLAYVDADDGFDGGDRLFPQGYDEIAKILAHGLDVRRGEIVRRIEHGPSGVSVVTAGGTHRADAAVVTVPLGVLKRGAIEFDPPLPPSKRDAVARLGMGVLNKIVLRFDRAFWPRSPQFFGYLAQQRGRYPVFMNWAHYTQEPVLMAFTGGAFARSLEARSDDRIADEVMHVIRTMFGRRASDPTAVRVARWGSDPFAGGSYSHVPVGATPRDRAVLAEPVGERLLFAGEATSMRYPGTVHGAYLSGLREAQRVIRIAG